LGKGLIIDFSKSYPGSTTTKSFKFNPINKQNSNLLIKTKIYTISGGLVSSQSFNLKTSGGSLNLPFTSTSLQQTKQETKQDIKFRPSGLSSLSIPKDETIGKIPIITTTTQTSVNRNRFITVNPSLLSQLQPQEEITRQSFLTIPSVITIGRNKINSPQSPRVPTRPIFEFPGTVDIPFLPFDSSGYGRVKGSRKRPKYTPDFVALTFKIKGKQPKNQYSLLGVRPITKGFKWSY